MEAHPIPQNVTSFQFHLVGDMTLKQFIYLAIGASIAYVSFVFLSPVAPVVAWPIIVVSASLGAAFAFIPISDRPLDYWVAAFFRAIYSPTKMVWKGDGEFLNRLAVYTHTAPPQATAPTSPNRGEPVPTPTQEELSQTVELAKQAQALQMQIIRMNAEATQIKQQLAAVTHEEAAPVAETKVQVITLPKPKPTQIVLTSTPNVINGIVVDSQGNYLDSAVVVIYNKDGLPVRALKTNKLGQFSGATPLPNGKYTLQLEKDNLVFDVLQVDLDNKVLAPISIAAKKVL